MKTSLNLMNKLIIKAKRFTDERGVRTLASETDKQKYTKNLAPLEFSGSKKEFSSWNITCLVVNELSLNCL